MKRLAVLGSTRGTNLQPIYAAIQSRQLNASLEIVISNKADAFILSRARELGLPTEFVNPTDLTREEYDKRVSALLKHHQIDLVVLIGYMRILSDDFIRAWRQKIINVHPSLLPAFAGMMDLAVHDAVLKAQVPETGCTVHYVTEVVDGGPIILQKKCKVLADDTPETLKARVQVLEGEALVSAIATLISS